jgi:UPF0755 protein
MEYYHSRYGGSQQKRKGKSRFRKFLIWFFIIVILLTAGAGYYLYNLVFGSNVWTPDGKEVSIYVPTNSNWDDLKTILYKNGLVVHRNDFEWLADKKNMPSRVMPGKYIIKDGMSNNELIDLLRSGNQTPVKVIFNSLRNVYQLAQKVGRQIEADSASIARILSDTNELKKMGLNRETIATLFIPNTYEFYWNTNARAFIDRMQEENDKFWNSYRTSRAKTMEMTKEEIVTLASIVEKETNKNDEKAAIAGVYINRLVYGWRLQADPTVVYAVGDFNIRRVLNVHKKVESPYNTYSRLGLPPGPICIPSVSSIDAVLNYEDHGYFYFCAKDDLSGYHVFAKTGVQHNKNAKAYQKALNELKIYE